MKFITNKEVVEMLELFCKHKVLRAMFYFSVSAIVLTAALWKLPEILQAIK